MPPTRPVCNTSLGPISRTSELLSLILTPITNARSDNVDSDSTEDMLFAIEEATLPWTMKVAEINKLMWQMFKCEYGEKFREIVARRVLGKIKMNE